MINKMLEETPLSALTTKLSGYKVPSPQEMVTSVITAPKGNEDYKVSEQITYNQLMEKLPTDFAD